MMKSREEIKKIKKEYPPGTCIKLINMDDPHPVPSGTMGTVDLVDDAGQIHCEEFHLAIIPGKDDFEVISKNKYTLEWEDEEICQVYCNGDCMGTDEVVDRLNDYEHKIKEYRVLVKSLKEQNQKLKLRLDDLGVEYL